MTFTVVKSSPNFWATFVISEKLPELNTNPMGEISPNLVTLSRRAMAIRRSDEDSETESTYVQPSHPKMFRRYFVDHQMAHHQNVKIQFAKHQNIKIQIAKHQNVKIQIAKHQNVKIQIAKHQNVKIQIADHQNVKIQIAKHQNVKIQIAGHKNVKIQIVHIKM
jgi:hypothetical protein